MKILMILFSIVSMSIQAHSFDFKQNAKVFAKKISRRPGASLPERTHKLLTRAQEDLSNGATDRAFAALAKLEKRTKGTPGEQAQIIQALAYAYAQKEKNDLALKTFERTLDLDALPQTPTLSIVNIIAQLYMMKGKHKKTEQAAKFWLAVSDKPSGKVYALLAVSLYEQKRKKEALIAIQKAVDLSPQPKESWLAMAVSLYFANEKYKDAAKVLKILVAQSPEKEAYWKQWAASHLSAHEEKEGLVALELGHLMGQVKGDKQIKNASSLMMSTDIPYKAAMWMEKKLSKKERGTFKVQKQLASAYMSARENKKALKILQEIHKTNPEAKTSIQLGQILLEEEKWENATVVFEKAKTMKLEKEDQEQIYMGLGVAHFNLGKIELSRESFVAIADTSEAAQGWLNFIQSQDVQD